MFVIVLVFNRINKEKNLNLKPNGCTIEVTLRFTKSTMWMSTESVNNFNLGFVAFKACVLFECGECGDSNRCIDINYPQRRELTSEIIHRFCES